MLARMTQPGTRTKTKMKLHQLSYVAAIAQSELNITAAAEKLETTQPAISRQLRMLENELGFTIFIRSGRTLSKVTPPGQRVVEGALRILRETRNISDIAEETRNEGRGVLSIGTTHTQARYFLPSVVRKFRHMYPNVSFHLHQGTSEQIAAMARLGRIDLAIINGAADPAGDLVRLPCYRWSRQLVVPVSHALAKRDTPPQLADLAKFPLVLYVFSDSAASTLTDVFHGAGLAPRVAMTARDSDVVKTYVRLGLGVGIVANIAVEPGADADLVSIDASHLFPVQTTWIGFRPRSIVRRYVYDFVELAAPHLTSKVLDAVDRAEREEIEHILKDVPIPLR